MRQRGFSLVEMLIVIAIMGILLAIATLAFNTISKNGSIESQTKEMYADLMTARSEALFQKTNRSVKLPSATVVAFYPNNDGSGAASRQKTFSQPIVTNPSPGILAFDANGMASGVTCYCVGVTGNTAGVDSIIISATSIMIGKRNGACDSDHISPK